MATSGTQDKDNPETGNIGYTRHRAKTIQRQRQHRVHKTQDKDNPETVATSGTQDKDNPETVATSGTQDTGQRQSRDNGNIGYTRHRTKTI